MILVSLTRATLIKIHSYHFMFQRAKLECLSMILGQDGSRSSISVSSSPPPSRMTDQEGCLHEFVFGPYQDSRQQHQMEDRHQDTRKVFYCSKSFERAAGSSDILYLSMLVQIVFKMFFGDSLFDLKARTFIRL